MSRSQEEVLEKVARGQLSADQANALLASMPRERGRFRVLLRPFESITTEQALLLSGMTAGFGFVLGTYGVHFDGALDLHLVPHPVALVTRAAEWVVSFCVPAIVFWLGARVLAKPSRFVDSVAAVGVARVPFVLSAPLLAAIGGPGTKDPNAALRWLQEHPARGALSAVVALCALTWAITLLYTGMKTASGLTGKRLTTAFVASLLLAEVVSKLLLLALAARFGLT